MSISVNLIGSASGIGARDAGSGDGPVVLKDSAFLAEDLKRFGIQANWQALLHPAAANSKLLSLQSHCLALATEVRTALQHKTFFTVFGGDHSCAIGTWSGVYAAVKDRGDLGLIWVDAHMDSHTPQTSSTGNFHGMPLATLLGQGPAELVTILDSHPKLKPEHVCLIGVRSYESGEAELLKRLNVRVFYIEEVKERGLDAVMQDALQIVTQGTIGYGITIDVDSIDPSDAPGTGVAEPNGLSAESLCHALRLLVRDQRFLGAEIVEFDPHRDINHLTEKWVSRLLTAILVQ